MHEKARTDAHPPKSAEVERLREEAKQAKEQYLRALAEMENAKKRLSREREELCRYAAETVVRELLPIVDSLDQALAAADAQADLPATGTAGQAGGHAVITGVKLIRQQLLKLLERQGVKRIATVGEPFDPHQHEAVAEAPAADGAPEGSVVEEVQVGYAMHGKVIRPAMVKVAKGSDQLTGNSGQETASQPPKAEESQSHG
jgi:molecular chaperone GrpE